MTKIFILILIISGIFAISVQGATTPSESCVNVKIYNPISNETDEKCFTPPVTFIKTITGYCAQVTAYGISPDGLCGEFSTPCDIPFDWEWVDSCDDPQIIETTSNTLIGGGNVFTSEPIDVVIEGLGDNTEENFEAKEIIVRKKTITIEKGKGKGGKTTTNVKNDKKNPTIVNVEVINSNNEFEEINLAPIPEDEIIIIESGDVTATTENDVSIINSTLVINDGDELHPIDFLPDEALEQVEENNDNAIEVDEIELKVTDKIPVYRIRGKRNADFLFIIPITLEFITVVNAQTGEIIAEETPFWSFLARLKKDKVLRKEFKKNELFKNIKKEAKKKIRQERRKAQREAREAARAAKRANST